MLSINRISWAVFYSLFITMAAFAYPGAVRGSTGNAVEYSSMGLDYPNVYGKYAIAGCSVSYKADSKAVILFSITDLPAQHAAISVKVNAFIHSTDVSNIYTTVIKPGTSSVAIPLDSLHFKGIGEISIKSIGSTPIVLNAHSDTIALNQSQLKQVMVYEGAGSSADLKALASFNTLYRGYENMLANQSRQLTGAGMDADNKLHDFLLAYVQYRYKFNLFFKYASKHWPGTYITEVLPSVFAFDIPANSDSISVAYIRKHYFDNWQYNNALLLNNPLFIRQIDLYMAYFAIDEHGELYSALDAINKPLMFSTDKAVKDFIHEYVLVSFMNKSRDNNMDKYMKYLYDNYLEMDICDESATTSDDKSRNQFYKRLSNIPKVQEGKTLPAITGFTKNNVSQPLFDIIQNKPYTLVFIWSSTCTHCEAFTPDIEAFAAANTDNLQVYAFAVDKEDTKKRWEDVVNKRSTLPNWTDVTELKGSESPGLSNVYYIGTPTVFLLDKKGTIISRSLAPAQWQKIIKPL